MKKRKNEKREGESTYFFLNLLFTYLLSIIMGK